MPANEDLLTKLTAAIDRLAGQQPAAAPQSGGLPLTPLGSVGPPYAQPATTLQPIGVSVPVTIPLPDGREISARVHFGPEAATNLQATAAMAGQMFGPYLQARQPYRTGFGWGGGYTSYNGRRRW